MSFVAFTVRTGMSTGYCACEVIQFVFNFTPYTFVVGFVVDAVDVFDYLSVEHGSNGKIGCRLSGRRLRRETGEYVRGHLGMESSWYWSGVGLGAGILEI